MPGEVISHLHLAVGTVVGRAGAREQLALLEHHLVLDHVHRDAAAGQRAQHLAVAFDRLGFVVTGREHRLHAEFARQRGDGLDGRALAHDQAGVRIAAGLAQRLVQVDQGFADELDAPVGARQRIEDAGVEHEGAVDVAARGQRQVQRRVVVDAQIASQPDQAGVEGFVHGDR